MRLWSLHPKYLDCKGIVALWREALLAKAVLEDKTKGYKNHPQLDRFKASASPVNHLNNYLWYVAEEMQSRGYKPDITKLEPIGCSPMTILVTRGQVDFEKGHLLKKLEVRNPTLGESLRNTEIVELNGIFAEVEGDVEKWEK